MFTYCLNRPITAVDSSGSRTYFINGISNDGEDSPEYADNFAKAMGEQNVDDVILIPVYTNQDTIVKTAVGAIEVALEMCNVDVYTGEVVNAILADLENNPLKDGEQINIVGYSGGGQIALNAMEVLGDQVDNVILIGTPVMEIFKTRTKISMIYAGYDVLSWNLTIGVEQYFGGWYGYGGYFSVSNIENTVSTVKKILGKA